MKDHVDQLWTIQAPGREVEILLAFLSYLTIDIRDVLLMGGAEVDAKFSVFNEIDHMVIPFIEKMLFGGNDSYTIDIILSNLSTMGVDCGVQNKIDRAWMEAKSRLGEPSSSRY